MATLDPINSAIDRVRLTVADTGDISLVTGNTTPDAIYSYYIDLCNGNEWLAAKKIAFVILGNLARDSSISRIDVLSVDNRKAYENYKDFLMKLAYDPRTSLDIAQVYGGGISKLDMEANNTDDDVVARPTFTYPDDEANSEWLS